eukprot:g7056.t1
MRAMWWALCAAIALCAVAAAPKKEDPYNVLDDAAWLRELGLDYAAERAELGIAYKPISRYVENLESLLKAALRHSDAPRPPDERGLFKACGCETKSRRHMNTLLSRPATPDAQKQGLFERAEGIGFRCLRDDHAFLPEHDEERCGPACYKGKPGTALEDYPTWVSICPGPMLSMCSETGDTTVPASNCVWPSSKTEDGGRVSLGQRVQWIHQGALNLDAWPRHNFEAGGSAPQFHREFIERLAEIDRVLYHTLDNSELPRPTLGHIKRCGCAKRVRQHTVEGERETEETWPLTPNIHGEFADGRPPLGYTCEYEHDSLGGDHETICGPLCIAAADLNAGAAPGLARIAQTSTSGRVVHLCHPGMTPSCKGCLAPGVVAAEELESIGLHEGGFQLDVPQHERLMRLGKSRDKKKKKKQNSYDTFEGRIGETTKDGAKIVPPAANPILHRRRSGAFHDEL